MVKASVIIPTLNEALNSKRKLRTNARKTAEMYSIERCTERLLALYEEMV